MTKISLLMLQFKIVSRQMEQTHHPEIILKKAIGSGCFGVVFQGQYKNSEKKCALKRIQKVGNDLSREHEILNLIKNLENVVQLEHIFYTKNDRGLLIQNLVFEYVESNLQHLIEQAVSSKKGIPEIHIKRYMYQLLNGLKNIHKYQIAHRDLKPQNVLLSAKGEVKICDFGSSKIIDTNGKNTPYIVSRYYRAPQLILCVTKYTTAIDIWAAGCILAELYTLQPFFKGKTEGEQIFSIAKRLGRFSKNDKFFYMDKVYYDSNNILQTFDEFDPEDLKKTFKQSKDQENLIDLLQKMLTYDYEGRITAQKALKHAYFNDVKNDFHLKK